MSKSKKQNKWTVEQHNRQLTYFITLMVDGEEKNKAEGLLMYAKQEPSSEKFKEIWTLVDGADKLSTDMMCPECHSRLRKLKPNGKGRWPLCAGCDWKKKNAGKNEQRVPASLAAPSAKQHLMTLAMIGGAAQKTNFDIVAVDFPVAAVLPRRKRGYDKPRKFNDKRDAGERRVWAAKEEFKHHGAKNCRGERKHAV